ncbi:hypothetical protein HDU96_001057 [Phlyctochytrium bullatum]|nr:hypothetical protein HDU96_001057 [Phlyctochytrium bullatum]
MSSDCAKLSAAFKYNNPPWSAIPATSSTACCGYLNIIKCDNASPRRITAIRLSDAPSLPIGVNVAFPSEIGQLDALTELEMNGAGFKGAFPADAFAGLTLLKSLSLVNNTIEGVLPQSILSLQALESLDLSGNQLSVGATLSLLPKLTSLKRASLARNPSLVSSYPDTLLPSRLPSTLQSLDLSFAGIGGSLPDEDPLKLAAARGSGNLTVSINLRGNNFGGGLPAWVALTKGVNIAENCYTQGELSTGYVDRGISIPTAATSQRNCAAPFPIWAIALIVLVLLILLAVLSTVLYVFYRRRHPLPPTKSSLILNLLNRGRPKNPASEDVPVTPVPSRSPQPQAPPSGLAAPQVPITAAALAAPHTPSSLAAPLAPVSSGAPRYPPTASALAASAIPTAPTPAAAIPAPRDAYSYRPIHTQPTPPRPAARGHPPPSAGARAAAAAAPGGGARRGRTSVFARMKPGHKTWIVERLIRQGRYVGMCGDGANDTGALKAAHVGLALSDSEASIVAPFTSIRRSVADVIKLVSEGRCALDTSFIAFKYMFMYPIVQLSMVATLNQMGSGLSNNQFLFDDMAIVLVLALLMLRSGAARHLAPGRPTDNLFNPMVLFSLIGHVVICVGFFVANVASLYDTPWFCPIWKATTGLDRETWLPKNASAPRNVSVDPDADVMNTNLITTQENTVIWLFTHFQLAILAFCFCLHSPHRRPAYTNLSFTAYLILLLVCLTGMLLLSDDELGFGAFAFLFSIREGVPRTFRVGCLILATCNAAVSVLWETVVVERVVRRWVVEAREAREAAGEAARMRKKAGVTAFDGIPLGDKLGVRLDMAAAMRAAASWENLSAAERGSSGTGAGGSAAGPSAWRAGGPRW